MITDLRYLKKMTDGNAELISEMIGIFTTQVKQYIADMEKHYERKNWIDLSRLAHKAKSSAAIMGMADLAKMLKELETLAFQEKNVDKFPVYIEKFKNDCERACEELKNLVI